MNTHEHLTDRQREIMQALTQEDDARWAYADEEEEDDYEPPMCTCVHCGAQAHRELFNWHLNDQGYRRYVCEWCDLPPHAPDMKGEPFALPRNARIIRCVTCGRADHDGQYANYPRPLTTFSTVECCEKTQARMCYPCVRANASRPDLYSRAQYRHDKRTGTDRGPLLCGTHGPNVN